MALVLRVLAVEGIDILAVEDPGAGRFTSEQAAASEIAFGTDRRGRRRPRRGCARTYCGTRAVLVTPAPQWPTGVVLAGHRRQQLIRDPARDHDGIIIEDDYDAEFRYDRDPVGAMQGLAPGPGDRAGDR